MREQQLDFLEHVESKHRGPLSSVVHLIKFSRTERKDLEMDRATARVTQKYVGLYWPAVQCMLVNTSAMYSHIALAAGGAYARIM